MVRASVLLVCTLFCAAVEGRRFFGSCPHVETVSLDLRLASGTWYVYGLEPGRWVEQCFKYELTVDSQPQYHLKETFNNNYHLFHTKTTNDYSVEYHLDSPEFVLKKKVIKFIPSTEKWLLVAGDYLRYLVLYRCQPTLPWLQEEEIQVWVRDEKLVAGGVVPSAITDAVKKAGYGLNELQIKKASDCK